MNKLKKQNKKIQTPEVKSIKELIGITAIRNGILFTDETCIKFLEIMPVNFQLKSEREQNYIIERYEELLKIVKVPFSTFTISKKADSKSHIDYVKRQYETEDNENVKQMIVEYQNYVREISYISAVKRRFIVAIPYVIPSGLKLENISFGDIENWLQQKSSQFKDAISKCGNDVYEPEDEDQFTAQIIFELLNVKSSEKERMVKL